jgi:hypothetical protein
VILVGANARRAGRFASGLAVVSVGLHVWAVTEMPWMLAGVMLVAAAVCLSCVPALWNGARTHTWMAVAAMSVSMLGLHAASMGAISMAGSGTDDAVHHAGGMAHSGASDHLLAHLRGEGWDVMHLASAVAALELVTAAAVMLSPYVRRLQVGRRRVRSVARGSSRRPPPPSLHTLYRN